jgi:enoyl-CoA hydratase/carnithine racemase
MDDEILYSVADGVGTVTLNRPQARNALTFGMYERLAAICSDLPAHGSPKVLVFTGAGEKAFAAGTDISQFRAFQTPEDALGYEERIDRILTAIETCPIPTVAAISGAVTGGGASIACACDMRIATANARFGFPVARTLGNCLSMSSYARLVALLGAARVKDVVFTARLVEAEEGLRAGLYNEIVPDHAALMQRAQDLARTISGHAPLTMRATKQALHRLAHAGPLPAGDDLVVMCYMSADFREGMEAFLGKRTPHWQGR